MGDYDYVWMEGASRVAKLWFYCIPAAHSNSLFLAILHGIQYVASLIGH